jgi:hypothetical protein
MNDGDLLAYRLDENKNAIKCTIEDVQYLFHNPELKIIKKNMVGNFLVSTVFLIFDHSHNWDEENHRPSLFETAIFGNISTKTMWRYSTYKEALIGHRKAIKKLIKKIRQFDNEMRILDMDLE